jgi:hypothetical protein
VSQLQLKMKTASGRRPYGVIFVSVLVALGAIRFYAQEQKLTWLLPYLMLLSPFRDELFELWKKVAVVDRRIIYKAHHIPEILAEDYSYDALRSASDNFRHPVVIRGLFNGTRAVELWGTEEYLPSVFENFDIPIVRNATVGTLQDDRIIVRQQRHCWLLSKLLLFFLSLGKLWTCIF